MAVIVEPEVAKPRCEDCYFWDRSGYMILVGHVHCPAGRCRKFPPKADLPYASWPITTSDDWCGEWQDKNA